MSEETNVQEALNNSLSLKKGDSVKGTVIKLEDNQAIVSVGYKYDGIIPLRELSSLKLDSSEGVVTVGQEVELKVVSINDAKEQLVLSKRAVDNEQAVAQLQARLESGEVFEVVVADVVKGGLVADVGLRAFIPASLVDRQFVEDFASYKGRTLRVIVKELDLENKKVILSAKDVLEAEYESNKQQLLNSFEVGQEVEGTVQRLSNFGAFVDLGGVDGLIHISELSWEHVAKPQDVVEVGQQVRVKIIKVDPAAGKLSLSLKAATPGPWEKASASFNVGDVVTGTVRRLVAFGAFVEIAPGVEGLVHISQLAHRHVTAPAEVVKVDQEVQVKVLELNAAEKRVSLSIKATEEAPAKPEKEERAPRERDNRERAPKIEKIDNPNVSLSNESMSFTLAEKFGDKFKNLQ